jgi:NAD(P)-dependent dehydrogenase (short-subunit alcohol dehydrogenase family)
MKKRVLITGHSGGLGQSLINIFKLNNYYIIGIDIKKSKIKVDKEYIIDINTLEIPPINNIDIIINNAAIQIKKDFGKFNIDDWKQTMNVNVIYPSLLVQHFKESLIENNGHVINIGSIHSEQTKSGFHLYSTSKGALKTLTKSLSLELSPYVKVNMISPAAIDTNMLKSGLSKESYNKLKNYHPSKSIGHPDKISQFILNIIQHNDIFLSGSIITYDGSISNLLNDPEN